MKAETSETLCPNGMQAVIEVLFNCGLAGCRYLIDRTVVGLWWSMK